LKKKKIGNWSITECIIDNKLCFELKNEKTGFIDPHYYYTFNAAKWSIGTWESEEFTINDTDGKTEVCFMGIPVI